jgi:hypothetical protein
MCGGSCFDFLSKHVILIFAEDKYVNLDASDTHALEPRLCTPEDIGLNLYMKQILYICPPKKGI